MMTEVDGILNNYKYKYWKGLAMDALTVKSYYMSCPYRHIVTGVIIKH